MFFITFYESSAKYVYLVDAENCELIKRQLGTKTPLEFEILEPTNLKETKSVWIAPGQVKRTITRKANDNVQDAEEGGDASRTL